MSPGGPSISVQSSLKYSPSAPVVDRRARLHQIDERAGAREKTLVTARLEPRVHRLSQVHVRILEARQGSGRVVLKAAGGMGHRAVEEVQGGMGDRE